MMLKKVAPFPIAPVAAVLWGLLAALVCIRLWINKLSDHADVLMAASQGVLTGTPHWRAFQNRLLSPVLVWLADEITGQGLLWFTCITLTIGFVSLAVLLLRDAPPWRAFAGVAVAMLLWAIPMNYWSYSWDYTEMLVMLAFCAFVLHRVDHRHYFWLFIVGIVNRESALVICLYLMLVAVQRRDTRLLAMAVAAAVLGVMFVHETRHWLFQYSMSPGVGDDAQHQQFGNHLMLLRNWRSIVDGGVDRSSVRSMWIYLGLLLFYAAVVVAAVRRRWPELASYGLAMLASLGSLMVFGLITEGRVLQPFVLGTALLAFGAHGWRRP